MAISVIIDGVTYSVAELGERNWGQSTTDLLEALGNAAYLIKGGNIPLDAEAVFTTYGLRAPWFASTGANALSTGAVRLANLDAVNWRNATDSADLTLTVDGSDKLTFDSSEVLDTDNTATVTNKTIDADNNTITNIDNADIKAGAAIDAAKIHDGSVSNTEFGYLDGVTSAIQTQLDTDAANLTSHTSDATIHFTEASIDHTAIQNIGTNTHAQIDSHIAGSNVHGVNEVMGTSGSTLQTIDILTTNKINDADDFELQPTTILTRLTSFTTDRAMASIDPANTEWLILANDTSFTLTIKNEDTGATAANRILTGTGANVDIAAGASVHLAYDSTESRWRVIGSNLQESAIDHTAIQNIGTNTHAQIDTHIAASSAHGVSGNVVGTTDTQTLTNKTIDADLSTITNIGTSELTDLGVTTAKLAASSVTGAKIEDNVSLPGTEAVGIPSGTTAQRAVSPTNGDLRYNSTTSKFEGYQGGAWGDIGGEGGAGGKNYVLNPDAAADKSDVTADSGYSLARTTTAAELAEESKGTAFLISGSSLTAGTSKVAWGITATGIDAADGGYMGRATCKILDTSGAVNGDVTLQVYDVDNSVYVGDSDTVTGTGTYVLSVPLRAGGDYEFHVIAVGTTVNEFSISGVTIEPVSQTWGSLGGWKQYDESTVTFSSTPTGWSLTRAVFVPYKDPANDIWRMRFNIRAAITAGSTPTTTVDGVTFKNGYSQALAVRTGAASTNANAYAVSNTGQISIQKDAASTEFNVSGDVELESKPTWADWDNTTPTATDVQYANARGRWYRNSGYSYTSANTFVFNAEDTSTYDTAVGISNASGVFSIEAAGTYDVRASIASTTGWAANTVLYLEVNRGSGYVQERVMKRVGGSSTFVLSGASSVKLSVGDLFRVTLNDSKTITIADSQTYIEVERRSDYSARSASLPLSTRADETEQYLIPEYRETSFSTNDGTFTGGTLDITRVGRTVTITSQGLLSHSSNGSPITTSALPVWARPQANAYNCYIFSGGVWCAAIVLTSGVFQIQYRDSAGSAVSRTDSLTAITISYSV